MTLSLVDPTTAPSTRRNADGDVRGSDYAALSRRVRQAGLFEPTPGFYIGLSTVLLGLFVAGWTAFALLGDSWYQLLVAAGLAIVGAQIAFLGHDIAHRQVFRSRRAAERAGALGSLLIGLTYGWWQDKHTRHHANPNHLDHDPDVGLGVIAWTPEQAEAHRGLGRFLVRWQAYLFFPLLLLEGIHLHISSARAVITDRGTPHRRLEGFFLAVYALVHVGLPFLVLSPLKAVLFVVVLQGVFGLYLGCSFAPNHKGMPLLQPGEKLDYLRRQVLTARNVYGGRWLDVLFGGLNFQIEHHLFPSVPRARLRQLRPIVKEYCAERGVAYHETGLIASYREALTHLHHVGEQLRVGVKASEGAPAA